MNLIFVSKLHLGTRWSWQLLCLARASTRRLRFFILVFALSAWGAEAESLEWMRAVSDLGSPNPEVRANAARLIREHPLYQRASREKWDLLVKDLHENMSASGLIQRLHKAGVAKLLPGFGSFRNGGYHVPLDDSWALLCAINDSVRTEFRVQEEPKEIFVSPPAGYNGYWQLYRIDGEPSQKRHYENGRESFLMVRS
jgi:hypothetical protein